MAHRSDLDLVKEATSTTGTGTLTLAGAVSGFVGVAHASLGLLADGDTGHFVARNGTEWEMFLGTLGGGKTTLARTTRLKSSTGAAVSFTSAPTVYGVIPGASLVGPAGPAFGAYRGTSNQSVTTNVLTKIQLNAEDFDTNACFDSTTNYRFTPNVPGYYAVAFSVNGSAAALTVMYANLQKNGANIAYGSYYTPYANEGICVGSKTVYLNGTDYLELFAVMTGTTPVIKFGADRTYLTAYLARPA